MRSRIHADDTVSNNARRFGSGQFYYAAELVHREEDPFVGEPTPLLFTQSDIDRAAERAEANPEDVRQAQSTAKARETVALVQKLVVLALWTALVFLAGTNVPLVSGG